MVNALKGTQHMRRFKHHADPECPLTEKELAVVLKEIPL
jgi:hypothetical protein